MVSDQELVSFRPMNQSLFDFLLLRYCFLTSSLISYHLPTPCLPLWRFLLCPLSWRVLTSCLWFISQLTICSETLCGFISLIRHSSSWVGLQVTLWWRLRYRRSCSLILAFAHSFSIEIELMNRLSTLISSSCVSTLGSRIILYLSNRASTMISCHR